jgi:transcriptional regulator with XRE-family HTH domain
LRRFELSENTGKDRNVPRMEAGKWIRALREERQVKPSEVERVAREIAEAKGNPDFCVSHSTLADIESGSIPSIHKLFSLSLSLRVSLKELLLPFGIDPEESTAKASSSSEPPTGFCRLLSCPEENCLPLTPGTETQAAETTLLKLNPQDLTSLPSSLQYQFDPVRYRYAVIGSNDDSMADLLPPGSLVEVDTSQNRVEVFQWRTARERPVYLVWHDGGYCCSWCQIEGRELTLVPHPLSQRRVQRLKMPYQADIIGRVVNAWLRFQQFR